MPTPDPDAGSVPASTSRPLSAEARAAVANAHAETTLALIGVLEAYQVEPNVADTAADVMQRALVRRLGPLPVVLASDERVRGGGLHQLVDALRELEAREQAASELVP